MLLWLLSSLLSLGRAVRHIDARNLHGTDQLTSHCYFRWSSSSPLASSSASRIPRQPPRLSCAFWIWLCTLPRASGTLLQPIQRKWHCQVCLAITYNLHALPWIIQLELACCCYSLLRRRVCQSGRHKILQGDFLLAYCRSSCYPCHGS